MDRFEVNKETWDTVTTWASGYGYVFVVNAFPKGNGYPVSGVPWYSAVLWCNARSEKEGLVPAYYTDDAQTLVYRSGNVSVNNAQVKWNANGYRLPTEAEWEKAARGGYHGLRFPCGDSIVGSNANYDTSGDPFDGQNPSVTLVGYYNGFQTPSGSDMANGFGLYDMAGNVEEYCWDWFSSSYYGISESVDPHGPISRTTRIIRGGRWSDASSALRVALRDSHSPSNSPFTPGYGTGFRTVRKAP